MSQRQLTIPESSWKIAERHCGDEGWANFMRERIARDLAFLDAEHNRRNNDSAMSNDVKKKEGRPIHDRCHDKMVERFHLDHPGEDLPSANQFTATYNSPCAFCGKPIETGDVGMMTTMSAWRRDGRK
jgi:hypothetical protein